LPLHDFFYCSNIYLNKKKLENYIKDPKFLYLMLPLFLTKKCVVPFLFLVTVKLIYFRKEKSATVKKRVYCTITVLYTPLNVLNLNVLLLFLMFF